LPEVADGVAAKILSTPTIKQNVPLQDTVLTQA